MALLSAILPSKIATLQKETMSPKDAGLYHLSFCSHLNIFFLISDPLLSKL